MKKDTAVLLVHCPDRKGLVAAVTEFIYERGGNIVYLDQYVDKESGTFFMRVEWELAGFDLARDAIGATFGAHVAARHGMTYRLHFGGRRMRLAVFVSTLPHCLYDVLSRVCSGEWDAEVPVVVSNHRELEEVAVRFGVEFRFFEINAGNRREQEAREIALLRELEIDLIVLARYMQILSGEFVAAFADRIVNIHHSFLPAFPGARPYHLAHKRGVKIIGATSHYVTAELDAGPIIEQDVVRVSHRDRVDDLARKGRDLERIVLARAVWQHIERKVLVYNNRTVIFD